MKPSAICYLFGAGDHYGPPPETTPSDFVIAVDGGLTYLAKYGKVPDLLIGDMDSLMIPPVENIPTCSLPQEKADTDMVAAIRVGWERGYDRFHIYGGAGGRLDHTLANIQCLADLAIRGGRGDLFDRDTVITAIADGGEIAFSEDAEGTVSVFAHSDTAGGVYEQGLKYPLENAALTNTYPMGISNEFMGAPSRISVARGVLIVVYPNSAATDRR
ncbi:MAG: thiamine diphosphokinase [Oscillospiraceae bacterium]|nr:thiamine diphosphokinase [Oscillospiraceae bacterium]